VYKYKEPLGNIQIPIYVGSEYNLVVEAKSDNFFGEDGFNDVKFEHTPDVSKIKRDEMAHQAILKYTSEYPGKTCFQ
jgi:hypothetical protein